MKKLFLHIALIVVLSLCFGDLLNSEGSVIVKTAKFLTQGNLAFSVRTATYNGGYAPRNAGVIWITDSQNQFVKTIKVWASGYRYTLIRWVNSSGQNTSGAITGASLNNHQLHNISWNGKNAQGVDMPDGEYKVNVEFTEHNATASNLGKFKQVGFTKGSETVTLTIPNETYFRDMSLSWTPVVTNGTLSGTVSGSSGIPIANAVVTAGSNSVISSATGAYSMSLLPGIWDVSCEVNGYITQVINGVLVTAAQPTTLNFSMYPVSNDDELSPLKPLSLSQAVPNPFNERCQLTFSGKTAGLVSAFVYNLKGQKIRKLDTSSSCSVQWDGRDDSGIYCVNGIYFIRVQSGNLAASRKVILQK
ncbi:MAG: DUF2271 domain-containing protein [Candidatus Cloacimonas sp.]|jgi:flagellar hook assembly protein FlgD|nr:DUF2271 domain-containing protein [Candidatus Cloacimonas sp.]